MRPFNTTCFYKLKTPVPACLSSLTLRTDLISAHLRVVLKGKFSTCYEFALTTDALGRAVVDLSAADDGMPAFFFNEFSPFFQLSFFYNGKKSMFHLPEGDFESLLIRVVSLKRVPLEFTLPAFFRFTTGQISAPLLEGLDFFALDDTFILV